MSTSPALSVIIGSPTADLSYIVTMMRWIGCQSLADQIEVVVVSPPKSELIPPDAANPFFSVKTVTAEPITDWADAALVGIRSASADIVVLGEDHAFPEAGWAEALLAAHRAGHPVVAPVIGNANPRTGQSCAHWMIDYGRWMIGNASGDRPDLPGHNTSYRRELLAQFTPDELKKHLKPGGHFHIALGRRGIPLFLAADAMVYHTHPSRFAVSVGLRFNSGRLIGGGRVREGNWSLPRRVFYALAAPLLLIMRLRYVLQSLGLAGHYKLLRRPRVAGWLVMGLVIGVIGEACAYLFGVGNAVTAGDFEEFHKYRQMSQSDVIEAREKWALPARSIPVATARPA